MGKLDGRCLCGAVTYSSEADPAFIGMCHCTDCQHVTGSAFAIEVAAPADQVMVSGDTLASFVTVGDDHGLEVDRRFCSACGSTLFTDSPTLPGLLLIHVGTLDDSSWVAPQAEIWADSAQSWTQPHESRPRFPRGPAG